MRGKRSKPSEQHEQRHGDGDGWARKHQEISFAAAVGTRRGAVGSYLERQVGAVPLIVLNPTRIRSLYSTHLTWGDLKFLRCKQVRRGISHRI